MDSAKHTSVSAHFGGKQITFAINRDDLPTFEHFSGKSAYLVFKSIAAGCWLVADIQAVLRFASLPEKQLNHYRTATRAGVHQLINPALQVRQDHVAATFAANPVAPYAQLAANVLAGALFGLDEVDAVFDDGVTIAGA